MEESKDSDLIFQLARYVEKRAIGIITSKNNPVRRHYCDCCKAKLPEHSGSREDLKHKPDCLYLQVKAILLLAPPENT